MCRKNPYDYQGHGIMILACLLISDIPINNWIWVDLNCEMMRDRDESRTVIWFRQLFKFRGLWDWHCSGNINVILDTYDYRANVVNYAIQSVFIMFFSSFYFGLSERECIIIYLAPLNYSRTLHSTYPITFDWGYACGINNRSRAPIMLLTLSVRRR